MKSFTFPSFIYLHFNVAIRASGESCCSWELRRACVLPVLSQQAASLLVLILVLVLVLILVLL